MSRRRRRAGWVAALVGATLAACGTTEPLALPEDAPRPSPTAPAAPPAATPAGTIRIAYPDVPATWTGDDPRDTAATDLAALWGLPLYRYDADGQLVRGLAVATSFPEVAEGWAVEVTIGEGRWSDGSPVTAEDVVATVGVLRDARPGEWSLLESATAPDPRTVRLLFQEPYGRWAHLLTGPPGVLPAAELGDGGLDPFATELPVVGGLFALDSYDAGRSASFVAHPDGPLGAPRSERLEVLFVPSFETALGLLDRGEVDVVLGHLALDPVARATRLAGVQADAPLGGTSVTLQWLEEGALGGSAVLRRSAVSALDLGELIAGLLSEQGASASSPLPGVDGPLDAAVTRTAPEEPLGQELVVLVPRWHEALGFTSRAVQRDLTSAGAAARLVAAATPELLDPVDPHDGAIRVRRDGPRPAVAPGIDRAAPGPADVLAEELASAFEELGEEAWEQPLFRIGVAHAWREEVAGVEASSWPGLALWNVGEWAVPDAP